MSLLVVLHLAFGWRVVVDETTTISVIQAWAHTVGVCVVHVSESSGNQQREKMLPRRKSLTLYWCILGVIFWAQK